MELLKSIKAEWSVISQAPFSFLILAALMLSAGYLCARWYYAGRIDLLRERLQLKSEQAETYKERALKQDEKVLEVVNSDGPVLREKTLQFVARLRDFIERYQQQDESLHQVEWRAATSAPDAEKAALWDRYRDAGDRVANQRRAEFERSFKVDGIMLRDELLSRLKNCKSEEMDTYEYPTNYFGYNAIANDLERLAKLL
ncbi:hypothetical protein BGP82_12850 [Pseudomonas putida]|uniref:Uncharacterized protein n=1 Tax=Pseudomonas putida TaxID=303 RepID=A0A2S3WLH2_PSEPU|nr:hypothetical protein [Pseudomonas putida]POG02231.1 hypothetical protein BGP82_12850 [Pseudomonas putida]